MINLQTIEGFNPQLKYLLAVSGGIDSVVLFHLFISNNINFSVVHCNFQLRDEDSIEDEKFVIHLCENNHINYFIKKFTIDKKGGESVEMAARKVRYEYFNELINQYYFDYVVTAHHLNDQIETFFINLARGSGLKGLSGMHLFNNKIFRPLISIPRSEIANYAKNNNLEWREDRTNKTLIYTRNKIRHQIVPVMNSISIDFLHQAEKSISIINESFEYIKKQSENLYQKAKINIEIQEENIEIFDRNILAENDFILIYHLLSKYGFTSKNVCRQILESHTGRHVENNNFIVWSDRERLIIEKKLNKTSKNNIYNKIEGKTIENIPFQDDKTGLIISLDEPVNKILFEKIDKNKVTFPLFLRTWKEGDYFYPINGNGRKKISKLFKDLKIPNNKKSKILLLCNNDNSIIYVNNYRLDDRFKVDENTKNFIYIYNKYN